MRRNSLPWLALTALLAAPAAHSQWVSAYATFSPSHFSNVETGSVANSTTGAFTEQTTSFWTSGVGGGVTLNFLRLPLVSLGFDLRGSTRPGTVGSDTALFGLKLGIHPPVIRLKPYVQASAGYVATRTKNVSTFSNGAALGGTFTNQYAAYEIIAGVDRPILPFLDWRIAEAGVGRGYNTGNSFTGPTYNLTFFTINTGLVAHF